MIVFMCLFYNKSKEKKNVSSNHPKTPSESLSFGAYDESLAEKSGFLLHWISEKELSFLEAISKPLKASPDAKGHFPAQETLPKSKLERWGSTEADSPSSSPRRNPINYPQKPMSEMSIRRFFEEKEICSKSQETIKEKDRNGNMGKEKTELCKLWMRTGTCSFEKKVGLHYDFRKFWLKTALTVSICSWARRVKGLPTRTIQLQNQIMQELQE